MECSQTLTPTFPREGPSPLDLALATRVAEALLRRYQGHLWGVTADCVTGIVSIFNARLSQRWGYIIKMRDLAYHDEIEREAMEAGGNLLERYGLSRGPFNQAEYDALPTTRLGDFIPDAA